MKSEAAAGASSMGSGNGVAVAGDGVAVGAGDCVTAGSGDETTCGAGDDGTGGASQLAQEAFDVFEGGLQLFDRVDELEDGYYIVPLQALRLEIGLKRLAKPRD